MKTPAILIPIKILTKKIAKNKQNSIFYAGKDIAEVKIRDRLYVLTTSGCYQFCREENGKEYRFDSNWPEVKRYSKVLDKLTDAKIRRLDTEDWCSNWGWFGINVWVKDEKGDEALLSDPVEVWSDYDEALEAFIEYTTNNLKG